MIFYIFKSLNENNSENEETSLNLGNSCLDLSPNSQTIFDRSDGNQFGELSVFPFSVKLFCTYLGPSDHRLTMWLSTSMTFWTYFLYRYAFWFYKKWEVRALGTFLDWKSKKLYSYSDLKIPFVYFTVGQSEQVNVVSDNNNGPRRCQAGDPEQHCTVASLDGECSASDNMILSKANSKIQGKWAFLFN